MVQTHAGVLQGLHGAGENAVEKDDEGVGDGGAGVAQGVHENDLAGAVGGQVLDQEHAASRLEVAFDLGVAAESLGFLADVKHGQGRGLGHPGGIRDAGGLAAGHGVDGVEADGAVHGGDGRFHHPAPGGGIGDQFAAVDVDRTGPPRRQGIGALRAEVHRLDLEKEPRRLQAGGIASGRGLGAWHTRVRGNQCWPVRPAGVRSCLESIDGRDNSQDRTHPRPPFPNACALIRNLGFTVRTPRCIRAGAAPTEGVR